MAAPLDELKARINEIESDLEFVALAAQLRPRIGEVLQWNATGDVLELVTQFMNAKSSRPEGIFGPLLIRLIAAFERYLRALIAQSVEHQVASAPTYDRLSDTLGQRNLILTGRILSTIDVPRDYLTLDVESLISNLATCRRGGTTFRLNAQVFSASITGANPSVIEKALGYVNVSNWWDRVGANPTLATHLQTKGTRPTGDRAYERLKELWRWRNHLAHGGDDEIALTERQLLEAINFVNCFSVALDGVVRKHLNMP